jgi:hypothetical protein
MPKSKVEEAKSNWIKFAKAYNSLIDVAKKLWQDNIGAVKYKVNIEKLKMWEVKLDAVDIPVPKQKIQVPITETGYSSKTKELQVKKSSSKTSGMTSRYKAKAIKKVVSSKKKARK